MFTAIGDSSRNRIAHINDQGEVTSTFGENGFNDNVNTLKLDGTTLYVGGVFTGYGVNKRYGAQLNTSDGLVSPNFSEPNGSVEASYTDGNGVGILAETLQR